MSGTTAIAVSFHAGNMTVTNLGDSRAVLGHRVGSDLIHSCTPPQDEEKKEISDLFASDDDGCLVNPDGKLLSDGDVVAIALSEDQTPYRKDERERLKNSGARICTIDQMEGKEPMHENWGEFDCGVDINYEGNIPRVWCAGHNYPGTAFTRSLGDSIAEHIGVSADPEILTKKVTKGDEFLVIASDGIFEFLTNQRVIDICAESADPADACSKLLDASYEKWLEHETRIDDITCIVLFLKNTVPNEVEVMKKLICKKQQVRGAKNLTTTMLNSPSQSA
jgi:cGMP-dependent protein kinase